MEQIKRIENGVIDTAYYLERSSRLRGQALRHYLGTWIRNMVNLKASNKQEEMPVRQSSRRALRRF